MLSLLRRKPAEMPTADRALPGRASRAFDVPSHHVVNGNTIQPPFPDGMKKVIFGLGCFWGAERKFWQRTGVFSTAVGYAAGHTTHPTYQEVCTGMTGHNEVVLVVYDPAEVAFADLVTLFFESHDPTQGMRQGNDFGTQYRSGIYVYSEEQRQIASTIAKAFGQALAKSGYGPVTTEIQDAPEFYYAEDYHQQYLAKNPMGYCGLGGTGVRCPVGVVAAE